MGDVELTAESDIELRDSGTLTLAGCALVLRADLVVSAMG